MKKLIALALVVGIAGWLAWTRLLRPAPKRACAHMHELCSGNADVAADDSNECDEFFDDLRSTAGPDEAGKTAQCMLDAKTCLEAVGCNAGGAVKLGAGAAKSFLGGFQKAMK